MLSATNSLTGLDIESGSRFGADNFCVEALVIVGLMVLPLIFVWTVAVGHVLQLTVTTSWAGISFVVLLFIATFDRGIASTGSIIHVLLWCIML